MFKTISTMMAGAVLFVSLSTGTASASQTLTQNVNGYLGVPYKWGGTTTNGMDCSGFILNVFGKYNIDLPRTSQAMAQTGTKVAKADLRPGDLVFFNTSGKGISHVGIFMGGELFAHADSDRGITYAKMESSYYAKRYVTARRITDDKSYDAMTAF